VLVQILNVLPLLLQPLLDSHEPVPLSAQSCMYPMPISLLIDSSSRQNWRVWCAVNVLGLLFAADVHLLLGGLALGEGITVVD
jgi:hypothetical protein